MNPIKDGMSESESIQYVKKLTDGYMKDGRLNVYDKKTLSFLRSFLKKHYKHINVVSVNNNDKWLLVFTGSFDKRKKELLDKKTNESLSESFNKDLSELDDALDDENKEVPIKKLRECLKYLFRNRYITENEYENHMFNLEDIDYNDEQEVEDVIDLEYEFVTNAYFVPYSAEETEREEQRQKELDNYWEFGTPNPPEDYYDDAYDDMDEGLSSDEFINIQAEKDDIIDWVTKQGQKVVSDIEEKFGENLSQISIEDIIEYISTDNILWKNFKHKFSVKDVDITTGHSEEKTTMTEQLTEGVMSKELWCDIPDVYLIRYDNHTPSALEYEGKLFDFDAVDAEVWDIYMDEWNADVDHNFLIAKKDEGYEDFVKSSADVVYNILDNLVDSGEYVTVDEVNETSDEELVEQPAEEVQVEESKKSKKSLSDILSEAIKEACKSKDKKEVMEQLKKFLKEDFTRDPKLNGAIQTAVNKTIQELDDEFGNFENKEISAYCLSTCGNKLSQQLNDMAGEFLKKKFYRESLNEDQGKVSYNGKSVTYEDIYEELYYVIDDYFRTLQDKLGITSGDISPEDTLRLDDIREELALCVMDVLRSETGDYPINESLDEQNPLSNLRPGIYPMFQFPNGDYVHVGYENGKLFAGGATNTGIFHEYEIDYDWDSDLDVNLQNLYDLIITTKPELNDENTSESLTEEVEDGEDLYKVIMKQGSVRLIYETDLSKEEALEIIDEYGGRWYDERGGEWKLIIETVDGEPVDDLFDDFYLDESLSEDTVKVKDHKWVNKGKEGTHGEFKTKKAADAQRKAMFANGYHEDLNESDDKQEARPFSELDAIATAYYDDDDFKSFSSFSDEELAILWANCLYTDANPWGQPYDDEVYETIASLPNSEEIFDKAKEISKGFGSLSEDFEEEEWPDEEIATCDFCGEDVPVSELSDTDCGRLCDYCIQEIESRGEPIAIYKNKYESLEEDSELDLTYPNIQLDDVPEGTSADELKDEDEHALDNFKLLSNELDGKTTKTENKYLDYLTQDARILTDGERFEYNDWYEDTVYDSADDFIKWIDYNIIQTSLEQQEDFTDEVLSVSDDNVFEFLEAVDSDIDSDEQKVADIMDTFDITEEEAKEYLKKYQEK